MWPYFFILSAIILLQFKIFKKSNIASFYIGILLLFLFAAMRGNGNGDYFVYKDYGSMVTRFDQVIHNSIPMEIGFRLMCFILNSLGLPLQSIIITMNFISIFLIGKVIKSHSPNKLLSLLIFLPLFYQFDMHTARNAVAIAITTYSVKFIVSDHPIKFIVCIVVGMSFHKSALIALPLYFLNKLNFKTIFYFFSILIAFILAVFGKIDVFMYNILNIMGLKEIASRFENYVNNAVYGYSFSLVDPRLILVILILAVSCFVYKKTTKFERFLMNCCWANIMIMLIFSQHTVFVIRLSAFYNVFLIILIPLIINKLITAHINNINSKGCIVYRDLTYDRRLWFTSYFIFSLYTIAIIYSVFIKTGIIYKIFI